MTHEFTLTRPVTDADQPFLDHLRQLAATTCQCKDVQKTRPGTDEVLAWFTWLEHCPLHTLTGQRYAG